MNTCLTLIDKEKTYYTLMTYYCDDENELILNREREGRGEE
jgi:hypothetical protein